METPRITHTKVGDMFVRPGNNGQKPRPLVVVGHIESEEKRGCVCIPISSQKSWGAFPARSRFLPKESWFTNQFETVSDNLVKHQIFGVYEDLSHLKKAKLKILNNIKSSL